MKNSLTFAVAFGVAALMILSAFSTGAANRGAYRSGAPSATGTGNESTCSSCHNGGSFGEPQLAWTISETMGGPNVTAYKPGTEYFVSLAVSATGSPNSYGFQSIFLDDTEAPNGSSAQVAGTFSDFDGNTRQSSGNASRVYIEQSQRNSSGVFNFKWTAPAMGFGTVKIYSSGNAVNGTGGTGGDNGSTSPTIITLPESSALPISLATLTARADKQSVRLHWTTDSEIDASHFVVERGQTGTPFTTVATLAANNGGNALSAYDYLDPSLAEGDYLYRLRMVDQDGSQRFSPLVSVTVAAGDAFRVWPNPTSGPVNISGTKNGYLLLDAQGQRVVAPRTSSGLDLSGFASGLYYLRGADGTTQRIVKR